MQNLHNNQQKRVRTFRLCSGTTCYAMTLSLKHSSKPFIHNAEAKQRSPMDRQRPYLPTDDGHTHPVAGRSIDLIPPHPHPTGV
jgi:hypothetical protein